MTNHVPQHRAHVKQWAEDFPALPFAGGEYVPGAPVAEPEPAPAPPPAPAPAPQAAPQPVPGQPAPPAPPPVSIEDVYNLMDERLPAGAPDPFAVELGLAPPPPQPAPMPQAQPGYFPPGMQPPVAEPQPQLQPGVPGSPQEVAAIEAWIDQRIQQGIDSQVTPRFEQSETQRRQAEFADLRQQYPQLNDPTYANSVVNRARNWAQTVLDSPDMAREPAFIEMVMLAGAQVDANQQQVVQPQAALPAAQGQPQTAGLFPAGIQQQPVPQVPQPAPGTVPIEQPGGAAVPPPQLTDQQLRQQAIKSAGQATGLHPFWRGGV